ncbi:MAG: nucleotide sugar dehydrogenase [Candidatus Moranbacteria bacterium]|nr:nucleotide sugar dehydrogenase [Candidatus Moranbacteria bacterium]NTW45540.1 nucleotide sugar dehydrogenase [Candidatus Moranbacteria bacterium]
MIPAESTEMTSGNGADRSVCVIGLGYVGLPIAVRAVERGYSVSGVDLDERKISLINEGKSPIEDKTLSEELPKFPFEATADPTVISNADIILICVPTPVDDLYNPDLGPVRGAVSMIAKHARKGSLVVLESTVNPGVSEEVISPMLTEAGFSVGTDIHLAHCPERINPGDAKWSVKNIPRVVGSTSAEGLDRAVAFYGSIVDGEIRPMKSIREAEAVKIVENSFRDINIAFVNELAKSFDQLGIDVKDVIQGAATKPFSFMPHFPSCGVGGHCIPVDPYYLIERAKQSGFDHRFLKLAREINNSMPSYTVELLQDTLNELEKPLKGTRIGVLGLAYKPNIDDLRESPAEDVIHELRRHGAVVTTFDPHVPRLSDVSSLDELLDRSDALVLATAHKEFLDEITPQRLADAGITAFVDGQNAFDRDAMRAAGIAYKGIGR